MRVIGTDWIICLPPAGCGWYWQRRTVKDHWWSRKRTEYRGAFWEDGQHRPALCSRPDDPAERLRWMAAETWEDWYGDCSNHVTAVSQLRACHLSAERHRAISRP